MSRDQQWMGRFEADAIRRGDERRLRLARAIYRADSLREARPAEALRVIDEARQLAQHLLEPWWELFYSDRRAGLLMKYLGQARDGLEQAVRNVVRLREPTFAHFPWRFRVLDHLLVGYLHTDPVGYAEEIRAALDALEAEQPEHSASQYLVLARRRWLAAECGEIDEAISHARRGIALAADDPDRLVSGSHAVFCYSNWCHSLWRKGIVDQRLLELAREGERLAWETEHRLECSEFQIWQALLAAQAGHRNESQRLLHQAVARVQRLGMLPDHLYYDALCAVYLAGEAIEAALAARDEELASLQGQGRLAAETRCRLERARLLRRLGRCIAHEEQPLRALLAQMRRPEAILAEWTALLSAPAEGEDRAP